MSMFWDHCASVLPTGGARAPWPERTPLGPQGQRVITVLMLMACRGKKMPICVLKPHQFVGHVAAEISGQLEFSHRITTIYPNDVLFHPCVPFCPLHHFSQLSLQVNYLGFSDIPNRSLNSLLWAILTSGESRDSFPESSFFVSKKQPSLGEDLFHIIFLKDLLTSHLRLGESASFFVVLLTMESVLLEKTNGSKINITHVNMHLIARNMNSLLLF